MKLSVRISLLEIRKKTAELKQVCWCTHEQHSSMCMAAFSVAFVGECMVLFCAAHLLRQGVRWLAGESINHSNYYCICSDNSYHHGAMIYPGG